MKQEIKQEIARRAAQGILPLTLAGLIAKLAAIGYRLDRHSDCRSRNRWIATGESYPAINLYVVESDTGLGFANVNARKDENFRQLQAMRFAGVFAVGRGLMYEI